MSIEAGLSRYDENHIRLNKLKITSGYFLMFIYFSVLTYVATAISPTLAITMGLIPGLFIYRRRILAWKTLTFIFIASILLVPSNMYKLPLSLSFDLEIFRLSAAITLTFWLLALLIEPNVKLRGTPIDSKIALLILAVFLSLMVNLTGFEIADEFSEAIKAFIYFTTFIFLFYFLVSVLRDNNEIVFILKFIVALGAVIGFFGILERITGYNFFHHLHEWIPFLKQKGYSLNSQLTRGGIRVAGSVSHPIAFSALLAMIVPLAAHFWHVAEKITEKLFFGGAFGIIIITIILTGSRTGFLGLVLGLLVLFIGNPANRRFLLSASVIALFVVHIAFSGSLGTLLKFLSPSFIEKSEVGNRYGRLEDYPRIQLEVAKKPLFGRGYGTFDPRKFFFVDNQYLKFAVELGVFGVASFIYLLYCLLAHLWRSSRVYDGSQKSLLVAITASGLVFALVSATFDTFGFSQVAYLFFILTAFGFTLILNNQDNYDKMINQ